MFVKNQDYKQSLQTIDNVRETNFKIKKISKLNTIISGVNLPEHYLPIKSGSGMLSVRARDYLMNERRFDIDRLDMDGFGYVDDVESDFFGYIIIPFKIDDKLVYYQGRDYLGRDERYKYRFPKAEDVSVGKSQLWFNQDALFMFDEVMITEGWADAYNWVNGISSQGWSMSPRQIEIVLESPVKKLVFYPDRGWYKKCCKTASLFSEHKEIEIVNIDNELFKDVNESCGAINSIVPEKMGFTELLRDIMFN